MEKLYDKLKNTIYNATANVIDVYGILYREYIADQENPCEALQIILEETIKVKFDCEGTPETVAADTVDEVRDVYFGMLQETARVLAHMDLDVSSFYQKLYKHVFESDIFPKDEDSRVALLYLLGEEVPGMPYYPIVDLIKINGDKFKEIVERLTPQIYETRYMLGHEFSKKTERASQIYRIMNQVDSVEEKVVYLAVLFTILTENGKKSS